MISKNQKTGIVMLPISFAMLFIPPLVMGVPVPFEIYFPIAIFAMIIMIPSLCLVCGAFDFNYNQPHKPTQKLNKYEKRAEQYWKQMQKRPTETHGIPSVYWFNASEDTQPTINANGWHL